MAMSVPVNNTSTTLQVEPKKEAHVDDPHRVALSKNGKAAQLVLSDDKLTVTGTKGFRTVRATHGVYQVQGFACTLVCRNVLFVVCSWVCGV